MDVARSHHNITTMRTVRGQKRRRRKETGLREIDDRREAGRSSRDGSRLDGCRPAATMSDACRFRCIVELARENCLCDRRPNRKKRHLEGRAMASVVARGSSQIQKRLAKLLQILRGV